MRRTRCRFAQVAELDSEAVRDLGHIVCAREVLAALRELAGLLGLRELGRFFHTEASNEDDLGTDGDRVEGFHRFLGQAGCHLGDTCDIACRIDDEAARTTPVCAGDGSTYRTGCGEEGESNQGFLHAVLQETLTHVPAGTLLREHLP